MSKVFVIFVSSIDVVVLANPPFDYLKPLVSLMPDTMRRWKIM